MPDDPRTWSDRLPDGTVNMESESRWIVVFKALRRPQTPRPTDAASSLAFLQELHDRLNNR